MFVDMLLIGDGLYVSGSVCFLDECFVIWSLKVIEFWFNVG